MRIFITGGTKGIGRAAALYFAVQGHDVAICGNTDKNAWEQTMADLRLINKRVVGFMGDVADYRASNEMIVLVIKVFGGIDVLINNAAISHVGFFADMLPGQWQKYVDTNLGGVINCTHIVLQQMLKQNSGCIINMSSIGGDVGASCEAVYAATKGGVNAFTKSLAKELGGANIRVNAIAAGVVETQMNNHLDEEETEELTKQIPLRRFAAPEEIVSVMEHLIHNQYITGQIITIDGGLT